MNGLAVAFTVSGLHGWLILLAVLAFFVAAIVAWFVAPRMIWAAAVAGGLCLWALAALVAG
jgi:hypothetical protein